MVDAAGVEDGGGNGYLQLGHYNADDGPPPASDQQLKRTTTD